MDSQRDFVFVWAIGWRLRLVSSDPLAGLRAKYQPRKLNESGTVVVPDYGKPNPLGSGPPAKFENVLQSPTLRDRVRSKRSGHAWSTIKFALAGNGGGTVDGSELQRTLPVKPGNYELSVVDGSHSYRFSINIPESGPASSPDSEEAHTPPNGDGTPSWHDLPGWLPHQPGQAHWYYPNEELRSLWASRLSATADEWRDSHFPSQAPVFYLAGHISTEYPGRLPLVN
jgi:hypothetical protein